MRYITLFERESHVNKSMQRDKDHKYKISKPKLNNLSSFFFKKKYHKKSKCLLIKPTPS